MKKNPLRHFDAHGLITAACRYYLGRRTIAACMFADHDLYNAWPELPEGTKNVIKRDVEEYFRIDDEARAEGKEYKPLGDDCDRKAWEKLRSRWKTKGEN